MPLRISPSVFRDELYKTNDENPNFAFEAIISHKIIPKKEKDPVVRADTALAQLQERMATLAKEKESNK